MGRKEISAHHKGHYRGSKMQPVSPHPPNSGSVIPTELHSQTENEFEGLSMTLILPNTGSSAAPVNNQFCTGNNVNFPFDFLSAFT